MLTAPSQLTIGLRYDVCIERSIEHTRLRALVCSFVLLFYVLIESFFSTSTALYTSKLKPLSLLTVCGVRAHGDIEAF